MAIDSGVEVTELRVDGGMVENDVAMQIQADILGITVSRPKMRESTALGSALLAGAAKGLFGWKMSDPKTFEKVNAADMDSFSPKVSEEERKKLVAGWGRAVERAKGWEQGDQ
jgi:glycerol kinase